MKFRILRQVSADNLLSALPPAYLDLVSPRVQRDVSYTGIVFHHDQKDVIASSTVRKALAALGEEKGKILAIGGNFTLEAERLLSERGIECVSLKELFWTDESYENIKVRVGAKVKRPPI